MKNVIILLIIFTFITTNDTTSSLSIDNEGIESSDLNVDIDDIDETEDNVDTMDIDDEPPPPLTIKSEDIDCLNKEELLIGKLDVLIVNDMQNCLLPKRRFHDSFNFNQRNRASMVKEHEGSIKSLIDKLKKYLKTGNGNIFHMFDLAKIASKMNLGIMGKNKGNSKIVTTLNINKESKKDKEMENENNLHIKNGRIEKGSFPVHDAKYITDTVNDIIRLFESRKSPIIYTLLWHPPNHCSFHQMMTEKGARGIGGLKDEQEGGGMNQDGNLLTSLTIPKYKQPIYALPSNSCIDRQSKTNFNNGELYSYPPYCVYKDWDSQFDYNLYLSSASSNRIIKKKFEMHDDDSSAFAGMISRYTPEEHPGNYFIVDRLQNDPLQDLSNHPEGDSIKLHDYLQENDTRRVFIVGVMEDDSIKRTAEDAVSLGYQVYIIENAIGVNSSDNIKDLYKKWMQKYKSNKEPIFINYKNSKRGTVLCQRSIKKNEKLALKINARHLQFK